MALLESMLNIEHLKINHQLFGLKNLSEEKLRKFLTEKIDYCVIYSINEDDMKFDNEDEDSKDVEKKEKNNQMNDNNDIII